MINGVVESSRRGATQGGPLSPLLASVLLGEVDRELKRRGYGHVGYTDIAKVYVCSHKAGQRVVETLRPGLLSGKPTSCCLSKTPAVWRKLNEWIQHHLGAIRLKQWKHDPMID